MAAGKEQGPLPQWTQTPVVLMVIQGQSLQVPEPDTLISSSSIMRFRPDLPRRERPVHLLDLVGREGVHDKDGVDKLVLWVRVLEV